MYTPGLYVKLSMCTTGPPPYHKNNSPKEWGRIARYWFSSYPIIKTFLFGYFTIRPSVPYPGVINIRFSWRDPSDKEMFLITKVTSSNFPIMWLCRKVVTANNKTFTFWCWNFPKKFVKLSAKFPLTNRSKEVFKGNYQRNLSVGVRTKSKK